MDKFEPPTSLFKDIQRHYTAQRGSNELSPVARTMPLEAAASYFRSSSAFHNWQIANPAVKKLRDGGSGDIIDVMIHDIQQETGWNMDTAVRIHWPTVAVLARKL